MDSKSEKCDKKKTHSEIEKRRRNKLKGRIKEMEAVLPKNILISKMGQVNVLETAIEYIKNIQDNVGYEENTNKFLSDSKFSSLLQQTLDGFILIVSCATTKILYMSDSVLSILKIDKNEIIGKSMFNFIHVDDISKVNDALFMPKNNVLLDFIQENNIHSNSNICANASSSLYFSAKFLCRRDICDNISSPNAQYIQDTSGQSYLQVDCYGIFKKIGEIPEITSESAFLMGENVNNKCFISFNYIKPFNLTKDENFLIKSCLNDSQGTIDVCNHKYEHFFLLNTSFEIVYIDDCLISYLQHDSTQLINQPIFSIIDPKDVNQFFILLSKSVEKISENIYSSYINLISNEQSFSSLIFIKPILNPYSLCVERIMLECSEIKKINYIEDPITFLNTERDPCLNMTLLDLPKDEFVPQNIKLEFQLETLKHSPSMNRLLNEISNVSYMGLKQNDYNCGSFGYENFALDTNNYKQVDTYTPHLFQKTIQDPYEIYSPISGNDLANYLELLKRTQ